MTTINHETEIVATGFDPKTKLCSYTIERDGKRWTVEIPLDHLSKHSGNRSRILRREHVAKALHGAMSGPHDGEKAQEAQS